MSARIWGQGPDPALLLHCTLAHGGAWTGMARHLGDRLSMSVPDLLSHGAGPEADRTQDFHDQATEAAMRDMPDVPAHLIGHSFGATLALRIALTWPARVRTLTLIEPVLLCAANGPGRAAHDAEFAPMLEANERGDRAEAARVFLSYWGTEDFDALPASQQAYVTDRIWIPEATEPALIHDRADLLACLPALTMPTLLIEGAQSPAVVGEINTRLAAGIEHARRATIEGAGHMSPLTHPEAVAQVIGRFLDAA